MSEEKKKYSAILRDVLASETPVKLAKGTYHDRDNDCYCLMGLIAVGLGFEKGKRLADWGIRSIAPEFFDSEGNEGSGWGLSFLGSLMANLNDHVTDLDDTGKVNRAIQLLEAEGL